VQVEPAVQPSDPIIYVRESNVDERSLDQLSTQSEQSVLLSKVDKSDHTQDELALINSSQSDNQLSNVQVEDSVHTESKIVQESQSIKNSVSKQIDEVTPTTDSEYDVSSDSKCDVIKDQNERDSRLTCNETEVKRVNEMQNERDSRLTCDETEVKRVNEIQSTGESTPGPETMLSWKDVVRDSPTESRCAVSLSNNVIFDLDVE